MNLYQARGNLLSRIGTDMVLGDFRLTMKEVDRTIEAARDALFNELLEKGDLHLIGRTKTQNTTINVTLYSITSANRLLQLSIKWTAAGSYVKLREMPIPWDSVLGADPYFAASTSQPVYRRLGKTQIEIQPAPAATVTNGLMVDYVPEIGPFAADTDDMLLPEPQCLQVIDRAEQILRNRLSVLAPGIKENERQGT